MSYKELKYKHAKESAEFGEENMIWIDTFDCSEDLIEYKLSEELRKNYLTKDDIIDLGAGLYLKKDAVFEYEELNKKHYDEYYEYFLNNSAYEVVKYHLDEFQPIGRLNYSYEKFLTTFLGFKPEDIMNNKFEVDKAIVEFTRKFRNDSLDRKQSEAVDIVEKLINLDYNLLYLFIPIICTHEDVMDYILDNYSDFL